MTPPPWKEAASVILVVKASLSELVGKNLAKALGSARYAPRKQDYYDYRLMMVKRSSLSSFMAHAYVFPGGLAEISDYSPHWFKVFEAQGITRKNLQEFCSKVKGPRPSMITNPKTLSMHNVTPNQAHLPPDIALRIAAIRETFEETGVLLLTQCNKDGKKSSQAVSDLYNTVDLPSWQEKIHKDPLAFTDFCLHTNMCPDIWSLHEWWDWLTPTSVGHRRFDTMFYICCLEKQPEVLLDQSEVITVKWCTPQAMLEEHCTNAVFMAPPQVYELSRLMHFNSFNNLQEFSLGRSTKGVERWLPIIITCKDGVLSLLPGDEMYPRKPDFFGRNPGPDYAYTLEEIRKRYYSLHRMEVRGPICTAYCSITPSYGHLQPMTYIPERPAVQSFL